MVVVLAEPDEETWAVNGEGEDGLACRGATPLFAAAVLFWRDARGSRRTAID
ncbi:hypothetical protein [Streptomyces yerevanensis]|uniref:hypothetical protein n=1 Tax=Streptomyces yerevanensis TaxID=66378 RepID=UPI000AEB55B7|nr:hypothetical protein [Streptomyces yerevanensis]